MKKSEEYTKEVGELMTTLGKLSLKSSEALTQMTRLSQENKDEFLTERLLEALEIKKQFDETMVKIINNLVRREDMR